MSAPIGNYTIRSSFMRVRILKPWICGGKNPPVGKVIDLPQPLAHSGIERGLCEPVKRKSTSRDNRAAAEIKKRIGRTKR